MIIKGVFLSANVLIFEFANFVVSVSVTRGTQTGYWILVKLLKYKHGG